MRAQLKPFGDRPVPVLPESDLAIIDHIDAIEGEGMEREAMAPSAGMEPREKAGPPGGRRCRPFGDRGKTGLLV
jgi:hypothetical protein